MWNGVLLFSFSSRKKTNLNSMSSLSCDERRVRSTVDTSYSGCRGSIRPDFCAFLSLANCSFTFAYRSSIFCAFFRLRMHPVSYFRSITDDNVFLISFIVFPSLNKYVSKYIGKRSESGTTARQVSRTGH